MATEESKRRTAHETFAHVMQSGRDELSRSPWALAVSALAGGLGMGLTGLGVALLKARVGEGPDLDPVARLLYPLGFIVVIIGRGQLFTENTLFPVALILKERRHVAATLRLWGIVLAANLVGTLAFAWLTNGTGALDADTRSALQDLGVEAVRHGFGHTFWSGVIGGWLIALVAWLVTASHWTVGQLFVIWLLTYVVGIGHFAHCIATSAEILSAVVGGKLGPSAYGAWIVPATLGNVVGGVVMVSLLEYGQVHAGEEG